MSFHDGGAILRNVPPFFGDGVRPVDAGIRREVQVLWENGVETTESCEGGQGHPFPEPTVRFRGSKAEGFRALAVALQNGLRVAELRRYWSIEDGEPVGPEWEMTFVH
jgi:hypothetical protein